MNITVRRIKPEDAVEYRNCRLASLKDSPHAFGAKYSEELSKPISSFEADAQRLSRSVSSSTFLAFSAGEACGQIGAFVESGRAYICAMWVSPKVRNNKVGTALVEKATSWLLESGHNNIYAWVVDNNVQAISFYKSLGFEVTSLKQSLPSEPNLTESLYQLTKYS